MKKTLVILLILSLASTFAACSGNKEKPSSNSNIVDNTQTKIVMMTQEYAGSNIAEIPMIQYDSNQQAFKSTGNKNAEIEAINNDIKVTFSNMYNNFDQSGENWIEIKTYPFTGSNYLQMVITANTFPVYGTDGTMKSYNFDKNKNKWLSVDDILKELNLSKDELESKVKAAGASIENSPTVKTVTPVGFLNTDGFIQILLELDVDFTGADTYHGFFSYTPSDNVLSHMNSHTLFDPYNMDEMSPPLSYMKEDSPPILSENLRLVFDTSGLATHVEGKEFSLDSNVFYSVYEYPNVGMSSEEIQKLLKDEYVIAEDFNIKDYNDDLSRLSYPAKTVYYSLNSGGKPKTCYDLFVFTDTATFCFHSIVADNLATKYHDEIAKRMTSVQIED